MKKLFILAILLGMCIQANATIIDTVVSAGMKIEYENPANPSGPYLLDGEQNQSGATAATANVFGNVTSIRTYSAIYLSPLSDESATVNFQIGWVPGNYSGSGYVGQSYPYSNYSDITYRAVNNTLLNYYWDFTYSGDSPFGLNYISLLQNGNFLDTLGAIPVPGDPLEYTGSGFLNLLAGNDYIFRTSFYPNVFGGIGYNEGDLLGSIAYNFSPVPEPSTFLLLGAGLAGLGFVVLRGRKE